MAPRYPLRVMFRATPHERSISLTDLAGSGTRLRSEGRAC